MDTPQLRWLEPAETSFGVRVVDLRPFALSVLSTSNDPRMAQNAMSYRGDDAAEFLEQTPPTSRVTECALRFPIDRVLLEGTLFLPSAMEDKWALYYASGRLLCIRSWQRQLVLSADVRIDGTMAIVGPITGAFLDDEPAAMTIRQLDFLLRSHALAIPAAAPLDSEPTDLLTTARLMFSIWGRRALFATHHELPSTPPSKPLRTDSLIHIAVARGERTTVERGLARGVPTDVLARDGLGLTHWALASTDAGMLELLLDLGCAVDTRSAEGATVLMNAVQNRHLDRVKLLVGRGADVNAADARGFTALHRACEMGELAIARFLLASGAEPSPVAQGHTPLALAELREEAALAALLREHAAS